MLSALNVFSSEQRGALRALSKLRNGLVHNVEQVIDAATKERLELRNLRTGHVAVLASDGIYSYFADAKRTTVDRRFGFLQLHMQVTTLNDGTTDVRPLPPRLSISLVLRRFSSN